MAYNAAHAPTHFDYGNSVAADFTYNPRLQLETLGYKQGTQYLFKLTYNYGSGNNGQIQSITDNVDATRSMSYVYDAWSRLKEATAGPVASPTWKLSWDYDRFGNRRNQNANPGISMQLTIDELTNRVTQIAGVATQYDAAGNMTKDDQQRFVYDGENRIAQLKDLADTTVLVTNTYDGAGFRVKRQSTGSSATVYVFCGTKVIAEYVSGALNTEYIHAGAQMVATVSGSTIHYHHPDHLSGRVTTDSTGAVAGTYGHYPFGETWYETGAVDKWKFTSYERDTETRPDYAMFRHDAFRFGRFMTPDLLAGSIVDPQSLSRYAYALNDPGNLVDPLGLCIVWCRVELLWVGGTLTEINILYCYCVGPLLGGGGGGAGGGTSGEDAKSSSDNPQPPPQTPCEKYRTCEKDANDKVTGCMGGDFARELILLFIPLPGFKEAKAAKAVGKGAKFAGSLLVGFTDCAAEYQQDIKGCANDLASAGSTPLDCPPPSGSS